MPGEGEKVKSRNDFSHSPAITGTSHRVEVTPTKENLWVF